jgi:lipoprotein-releasing system ATP-binding protein
MSNILELVGINKSFIQGDNTVNVLNSVSLKIATGEMVALIGPSGSGKSTLLHIAGLLDTPNSGAVIIGGNDCSNKDDSYKTEVRLKDIGFVYQFHHLLKECTVLENVMLPLLIKKAPYKAAEQKAITILSKLGLEHRLQHLPNQLSGGEQQRTAIARALINEPKLLLADEPTGNLDNETSEQVFSLLYKLVKEMGLATLIVTHNLVLAERMDRVIRIAGGKLA